MGQDLKTGNRAEHTGKWVTKVTNQRGYTFVDLPSSSFFAVGRLVGIPERRLTARLLGRGLPVALAFIQSTSCPLEGALLWNGLACIELNPVRARLLIVI